MIRLAPTMAITIWMGRGTSFWHASNVFAQSVENYIDIATWNPLENAAYFGFMGTPIVYRIHRMQPDDVYVVRVTGMLTPGELRGLILRSLRN